MVQSYRCSSVERLTSQDLYGRTVYLFKQVSGDQYVAEFRHDLENPAFRIKDAQGRVMSSVRLEEMEAEDEVFAEFLRGQDQVFIDAMASQLSPETDQDDLRCAFEGYVDAVGADIAHLVELAKETSHALYRRVQRFA